MKGIGKMTVIAAVVHFLCFIVGVQGQIGVTICSFATQAVCPTSLPNSYCNLASLSCECATGADYFENSDGSGCDYNCGAPSAPVNGSVDTTQGTLAGDVATYSCNNGYKVAGTSKTTCVQDFGWDNTAATCVKGEIGDDCSSDALLCGNIAFGYCQGTCKCSPGYEDDGTSQNCQDINECENATCQNGATCVDEINRYTCICSPGYDGTYCTNDIDECVSNPCQNGATCNDLIDSYSCTCVNGYSGEHCQTNCGAPSAPVNGSVDTTQGTLAGDVATYSCNNGYKVAGTSKTTCVQDFGWDNTAATCVKGEIGDDCSSDALLCGNIAFGYCQGTCKCSPGYEDDGTSQNCQDINECENATCQNGATCVDEINRYTCICSPGYDGTYCTNDIDECVSNPCQNGATCNDLIDSYSCTCVNGYSGEHCQTNCEMVVASETEIGIKKPAPYSIHSVSSLSACENLCLSDAKCKEASFLFGSNLFCALYDTSLHDPVIDDKMNEEDKHLQKVCDKGCGSTNSIPNGEITLDSGNTSYGAVAAVTCFNGYEADTETVICLETGNWTNARCLPKDCGEPYKILHGTITTLVRGSTTFGAKANVVCDPGYQVKNSETSVTETDAGTISCLVTGLWEEVYCSAKDQNDAGDSSTILVIILACSLTAAVSIALTTVALFVYRKYKRVKLSTPTSNPEPAVYYNAAVTDNLEGTGADNNQYEHLNVTRETETN